MPPQFILPDAYDKPLALVLDLLLVKPKVDKARRLEDFGNVLEYVRADLVVRPSRKHAPVFLEPHVVRRREVELRDGFNSLLIIRDYPMYSYLHRETPL